jgi:ActR/RegA family two-component response regulator
MQFAAGILVFEAEPRWAPLLKRQLAQAGLLVRPCRAADDVLSIARRMPGATVVVDLAAGPARALHLLAQLLLWHPGAHAVAVVSHETRGLEWTLRELGAISVIDQLEAASRLHAACRQIHLVEVGGEE